jgi:hypothetical protein
VVPGNLPIKLLLLGNLEISRNENAFTGRQKAFCRRISRTEKSVAEIIQRRWHKNQIWVCSTRGMVLTGEN